MEEVRSFGAGAVPVGIFRRVGVVYQTSDKTAFRAWRVPRSMQQMYPLSRCYYFLTGIVSLNKDLHGPRSTLKEARSPYHHSCCAVGPTTISSVTS